MKFVMTVVAAVLVTLRADEVCDPVLPDICERDGMFVLEIENMVGNWTGWNVEHLLPPFTNGRYVVYRGESNFGALTPGDFGGLSADLRVATPGTYLLRWRSYTAYGDDHTEHNDSWLRVTGAGSWWFGQQGTGHVFPRGGVGSWQSWCVEEIGPCEFAEGSSGNGYFKVFQNTLGSWDWKTSTSDHDDHHVLAHFANPGDYKIELAGRSYGHAIDRLVGKRLPDEYAFDKNIGDFVNATFFADMQTLEVPQTNCAPPAGPVVKFVLVDPVTNQHLRDLAPGVNFIGGTGVTADTFNVEAVTSYDTEEVYFETNLGSAGLPLNVLRSSPEPFRLDDGDKGSGAHTSIPLDATRSIKATPFKDGRPGPALGFDFSVQISGFGVSGLSLANADTDAILQPLLDRTQVNLTDLGLPIEAVNVLAVVEDNSDFGSVKFDCQGPPGCTGLVEGNAPYFLFGNLGDDVLRGEFWETRRGTSHRFERNREYTITATPYSLAGATGTAGTPVQATVTFI